MALIVRTTAGASTPGFVQPGSTRRAGQIGGGHAAGACRSAVWVNSGYQRWKSSASWLLRTRVRTCSSRWAPRGDQRICCFLTIRLLVTWLTADSTNELSITAGPDGPPTKSGLSLVDFSSGIAAALALVAGVHSARRDQKGMDCCVIRRRAEHAQLPGHVASDRKIRAATHITILATHITILAPDSHKHWHRLQGPSQ